MFKGNEINSHLDNVQPSDAASRSFDVGLLKESKDFWDKLLDSPSEDKDTILSKEPLDTEKSPNLEFVGTISEGSLREAKTFWDTLYSSFNDNQDLTISYKPGETDQSVNPNDSSEVSTENDDAPNELSNEEKAQIKEETGWSDEIIDNIQNMKQYEILKNANLVEVEINGRKCLIRTDVDLDKEWNTGKFDENGQPIYETNRERMEDGKPPLDEKGKPIQLHHLGQKSDSPLVELTEEEHRTGEYENGKKNQSLWHDNTKETEVHGEFEGRWIQERRSHWESRYEMLQGGENDESNN